MLKEWIQKYKQSSAVVKLIALNGVLFIFALILGIVLRLFQLDAHALIQEYLYLPLDFGRLIPRFWTLITYMFLHDLNGIFHILFNMLFLYWFGSVIETLMGDRKIFAIYVLGGIVGGILAILAGLSPLVNHTGVLVGASGAVYAVVFAAVMLSPNYAFHLLFIGRVEIKYIAILKLTLDLIYIYAQQNVAGSVCHIGGALFGVFFIYLLKQGIDLSTLFNRVMDILLFKPAPRSKLKPMMHGTTSKASSSKSTNQQEIDLILDKISQSGYDSLTDLEKQTLFKASKD